MTIPERQWPQSHIPQFVYCECLWWAGAERGVSAVVSRSCPLRKDRGRSPRRPGKGPLSRWRSACRCTRPRPSPPLTRASIRRGRQRTFTSTFIIIGTGVSTSGALPPHCEQSTLERARFRENLAGRRFAFHVMTHIMRYICALPFADSFRFVLRSGLRVICLRFVSRPKLVSWPLLCVRFCL